MSQLNKTYILFINIICKSAYSSVQNVCKTLTEIKFFNLLVSRILSQFYKSGINQRGCDDYDRGREVLLEL